jgi:hypothetical protein
VHKTQHTILFLFPGGDERRSRPAPRSHTLIPPPSWLSLTDTSFLPFPNVFGALSPRIAQPQIQQVPRPGPTSSDRLRHALLHLPRLTFLSEWNETCPTAISPVFCRQPAPIRFLPYLEVGKRRIDNLSSAPRIPHSRTVILSFLLPVRQPPPPPHRIRSPSILFALTSCAASFTKAAGSASHAPWGSPSLWRR